MAWSTLLPPTHPSSLYKSSSFPDSRRFSLSHTIRIPRTHPMSSTSPYSSPSPSESSSSTTLRPTSTRDDSSVMEPPRKRARSDLSTEQRREARAHRNRIAAQNSRDKRKAQFAYMEKRMAELEEENQRLRAGMGLSQFTPSAKSVSLERESVQARENRELKERIKSLESGWSAVIKALQASGLPLNIQVPAPTSVGSPLPPSTSSASSLPTIALPSPTVYPLSPATSTSSLSSSNIFEEFESTRHLARVATVESGAQLTSTSLQRVDSQRAIISPNSTSLLHPQRRRRLLPTTQSQHRSATALWKNSCGRSLPLHLRHQLRLSLSKSSPKIFKPPTSRRHPPSRR